MFLENWRRARQPQRGSMWFLYKHLNPSDSKFARIINPGLLAQDFPGYHHLLNFGCAFTDGAQF